MGLLRGLIGDGNNDDRTPRLDASTHAIKSIEYSHSETHSGNHFNCFKYDSDLDDTETIELIITTPNTTKWGHFKYSVTGALTTLVELYENTTHTAGAAITAYNHNRNSVTAAGISVNVSNDDEADGDGPIDADSFGIATSVGVVTIHSGGGMSRGDSEWILKQNTKYLLKVTSGADDNNVSINMDWYEHTDKN